MNPDEKYELMICTNLYGCEFARKFDLQKGFELRFQNCCGNINCQSNRVIPMFIGKRMINSCRICTHISKEYGKQPKPWELKKLEGERTNTVLKNIHNLEDPHCNFCGINYQEQNTLESNDIYVIGRLVFSMMALPNVNLVKYRLFLLSEELGWAQRDKWLEWIHRNLNPEKRKQVKSKIEFAMRKLGYNLYE